jgi:hypothetical protein
MAIDVVLTPEDQAKVEANQKSDDKLPSYYNADIKQDAQISRDFEAFLILSPTALKTSALSWIQKAKALNRANQLRDELTQLSINQELKNAQAKIAAYDLQLQYFSDFRKNFQSQTAFAGVAEVQKFLSDLQRVIGELVVARERAYFDQTVCKVFLDFDAQAAITDDQVQELQSWSAVISEYLGVG